MLLGLLVDFVVDALREVVDADEVLVPLQRATHCPAAATTDRVLDVAHASPLVDHARLDSGLRRERGERVIRGHVASLLQIHCVDGSDRGGRHVRMRRRSCGHRVKRAEQTLGAKCAMRVEVGICGPSELPLLLPEERHRRT